jgi:hypothetical protein
MASHGLAVVHAMPGRLRLRVPVPARTSGLPEAIAALPGVTDATWNPRSRGLLVRYEGSEITGREIIHAAVSHAGVGMPRGIVDDAGRRDESVGAGIASAVGDLNTRVSRATAGHFDLGALVPIALSVWAVAEMVRSRVDPLSWSSALWYAHGLFRDYALRERS